MLWRNTIGCLALWLVLGCEQGPTFVSAEAQSAQVEQGQVLTPGSIEEQAYRLWIEHMLDRIEARLRAHDAMEYSLPDVWDFPLMEIAVDCRVTLGQLLQTGRQVLLGETKVLLASSVATTAAIGNDSALETFLIGDDLIAQSFEMPLYSEGVIIHELRHIFDRQCIDPNEGFFDARIRWTYNRELRAEHANASYWEAVLAYEQPENFYIEASHERFADAPFGRSFLHYANVRRGADHLVEHLFEQAEIGVMLYFNDAMKEASVATKVAAMLELFDATDWDSSIEDLRAAIVSFAQSPPESTLALLQNIELSSALFTATKMQELYLLRPPIGIDNPEWVRFKQQYPEVQQAHDTWRSLLFRVDAIHYFLPILQRYPDLAQQRAAVLRGEQNLTLVNEFLDFLAQRHDDTQALWEVLRQATAH